MRRFSTPVNAGRRLVLLVVGVLLLGLAGFGARATVTSLGGEGGDAGGSSASTDAGTTAQADESQPDGAGGAPSRTGADGTNNEVVVLNVTDGSFKNRAGFGTARITGDTVDSQNAAAATSSCSDCRTVAVAVQVVLVQSNTHTATPNNLAIALNQNCSRCESYAGAFQYVVSTGGLVRFTAEGESRMAAIQNEIRDLAGQRLPFPELDARLGELVDQLWATVDQEMVRLGVGFTATPSARTDIETADTAESQSPSPSPTESGSSPTSAGSPSPSETSAPDPSGTPTTTPSDSPS